MNLDYNQNLWKTAVKHAEDCFRKSFSGGDVLLFRALVDQIDSTTSANQLIITQTIAISSTMNDESDIALAVKLIRSMCESGNVNVKENAVLLIKKVTPLLAEADLRNSVIECVKKLAGYNIDSVNTNLRACGLIA